MSKCAYCSEPALYLVTCKNGKWSFKKCEYHVQENKVWSCDTITKLEDHSVTFDKFSQTNAKRCEGNKPNGFAENIKEYGPDHWLKAFNEEVGEVNGAILGMSGKKERKKHLTREDVLDEIGDAVACLDLLAQSLDSSLGECAVRKFNKVSERIGSNIKL